MLQALHSPQWRSRLAVDTDPLLTARDVAGLLGLSIASVLRRWRAGELPGFRLSSNVLRFRRSDIDAWLNAHRVDAHGSGDAG
jgi:predicted DNA-binding transcriptional regulator AlpA